MSQAVRREGKYLPVSSSSSSSSSSADQQQSESSTHDKHLLQNLEPESTFDHTEPGERSADCDNPIDYLTLFEHHEPREFPGGDNNVPEYLQLEQLEHDVIEDDYIKLHTYEQFDFGVSVILILYYI